VARATARRASTPSDPWAGLLEPALAARPLRARRMFGCLAYYDAERLVWVSAARREPWHGILIPTERAHHAALRARLPGLRAHPVLGKWLYASSRHPDFEVTALRVAALIGDGDPLIGVTATLRRRRRARRKEREE
jgi:hypothetical protein